jgi:hypothetical protein
MSTPTEAQKVGEESQEVTLDIVNVVKDEARLWSDFVPSQGTRNPYPDAPKINTLSRYRSPPKVR